MADFFPQTSQNQHPISLISHKRKSFSKQIRRNYIFSKINQLRIVGSDGPHIKSLVNALPSSWFDMVEYMVDNPSYHEAITKTIIDKIYSLQLSEESAAYSSQNYFLVPQNPPQILSQVKGQIYFFGVMFQFQGIYAPNILKRYFSILLNHAKLVNAIDMIFQLFNQIVKRPELNWVPQQQIKETIRHLQNIKNQEQTTICSSEVQLHFYLVSHYYSLARDIQPIRNRIIFYLQKGSECFSLVKPKLFFKLCLMLTYNQESHNQNSNSEPVQNQNPFNTLFHNAMIKGRIVKNLYRHIFFSSKEKIQKLCLNLLKNLILQYGSLFLWNEQKLSPIEHFQQSIRDQSNSMSLFQAFSEVFLISIIQLPSHQLSKIFQNDTEVLELILYILQSVEKCSDQGKQIHEYTGECLWYMFEEGTQQIQEALANTLLDSRWKNIIGKQSQLINQCQKFISSQP